MPKRNDPTNATRSYRRLAKKNAVAVAAGWPSWSAFETAVINAKVTIPPNLTEEIE